MPEDFRQPVNHILKKLEPDQQKAFIHHCNNDPDFLEFVNRALKKSPKDSAEDVLFNEQIGAFFKSFLSLIEPEKYQNIKITALGTLTVLAASFAALVILAGFSASIIGPVVALAVVIVGCFFHVLHQKKQADQRVNSAIFLLNSSKSLISDQKSSSMDPMQP